MSNGERTIKVSFFILCFLCLSVLGSQFSVPEAADTEKELKDIQKKLQEKKQKVKQTIRKEKSTLEDLDQITRTLSQKRSELKNYTSRRAETGSKIIQLQGEIRSINSQIDSRKKLLKVRLRSIYKQQHGDIASLLISAQDYQQLAKRIRYLTFFAHYDSRLMDTYGNELRDLGVKMQSMEILQRELEVNEANVRKAALEMETERKKKDALLASIRRERDTYNDMIKQLEVSSERLRNMMKDLEDKELPSSVTGKGFGALKNRLPWPVAGSVIAPYGKYTNPEFNIPTFRKGVEIKADIGDMVLAAASGKVVYADFFKGYGLLLIINHGDGYHTLYAHLSEIFPKTGDIIKDRQSVGKIGESGILNDPSLYFEIRHKGKPLNPLEWLSRK